MAGARKRLQHPQRRGDQAAPASAPRRWCVRSCRCRCVIWGLTWFDQQRPACGKAGGAPCTNRSSRTSLPADSHRVHQSGWTWGNACGTWMILLAGGGEWMQAPVGQQSRNSGDAVLPSSSGHHITRNAGWPYVQRRVLTARCPTPAHLFSICVARGSALRQVRRLSWYPSGPIGSQLAGTSSSQRSRGRWFSAAAAARAASDRSGRRGAGGRAAQAWAGCGAGDGQWISASSGAEGQRCAS